MQMQAGGRPAGFHIYRGVNARPPEGWTGLLMTVVPSWGRLDFPGGRGRFRRFASAAATVDGSARGLP
jgi:hypothetical protein